MPDLSKSPAGASQHRPNLSALLTHNTQAMWEGLDIRGVSVWLVPPALHLLVTTPAPILGALVRSYAAAQSIHSSQATQDGLKACKKASRALLVMSREYQNW